MASLEDQKQLLKEIAEIEARIEKGIKIQQKTRDTYNQKLKESATLQKASIESNKIDPLSGCFRYLLDNDKINKIIFGVQDSIQLQEIMKISNKPLIKFPKWPKIIDEKLLNPSHWKK